MAQPKLRGRDREVERRLLAALDAHLPHGRARVTLRLALESAGISTPPDEPAGLGLFVCGALADQIEQRDAVDQQLNLGVGIRPTEGRTFDGEAIHGDSVRLGGLKAHSTKILPF